MNFVSPYVCEDPFFHNIRDPVNHFLHDRIIPPLFCIMATTTNFSGETTKGFLRKLHQNLVLFLFFASLVKFFVGCLLFTKYR